MVLLKSIVFIYSLTGILVYFFNKRFEYLVPFSFITYALVLLFSGLINNIKLGYYLLWVCILLFYIFLFIKRNQLAQFKENYFTIGFFIFLFLIIFIYFLQINRGFNFWDEFGHWGPMVKESFRLNKLYLVSESSLQRHKDYPPFFTLIELLWCYFKGSYSEGLLYVSLTTFSLSLFMPLFDFKKINLKNSFYSIVLLLLTYLVLITIGYVPNASDGAHFFNSIYVDWPLAIFLAFTFNLILNEDQNNILIIMSLISLLLMKQMGLPFFLLSVLLLVIKKYFINKEKINIIELASFILIPMAFYFGWALCTKHFGVAGNAQFKISSINISDFIKIIKEKDINDWHYLAFKNFISAILNNILVVHPFKTTYFIYAIFISISLIVGSSDKKTGMYVAIVYLFGSVAYSFALLLLYMFCFGPTDGVNLASFDRFFITYLFFGTVLAFMRISSLFEKNTKILIISSIVIALLVEPQDLKEGILNNNRSSLFGDNPIESITGYDISKNDKVLVIEQNIDDAYEYAEFGYLECENIHTQKFDICEWENDNSLNLSLDDFKNYISSYDYVYIISLNDYFIDYYCNDELPLNEIGLYKIDKDNITKVQ